MYERKDPEINPTKYGTTVERKSERELVVTRTFNGPARLVFEAWTKPELLKQWWAPKSFEVSFLSCEADVRTGGAYRFVFALVESAVANGVRLRTLWEASTARWDGEAWHVRSRTGEEIAARWVVNAAGLRADAVSIATNALAEVTTSIPHYWSPASSKYPAYVKKYDQYASNGQAASEGITIGSTPATARGARSTQRSS
mgnify:CR=1 FL=1